MRTNSEGTPLLQPFDFEAPNAPSRPPNKNFSRALIVVFMVGFFCVAFFMGRYSTTSTNTTTLMDEAVEKHQVSISAASTSKPTKKPTAKPTTAKPTKSPTPKPTTRSPTPKPTTPSAPSPTKKPVKKNTVTTAVPSYGHVCPGGGTLWSKFNLVRSTALQIDVKDTTLPINRAANSLAADFAARGLSNSQLSDIDSSGKNLAQRLVAVGGDSSWANQCKELLYYGENCVDVVANAWKSSTVYSSSAYTWVGISITTVKGDICDISSKAYFVAVFCPTPP